MDNVIFGKMVRQQVKESSHFIRSTKYDKEKVEPEQETVQMKTQIETKFP